MAFKKMIGLHGTIKMIPESMVEQKLAIGYTIAGKQENVKQEIEEVVEEQEKTYSYDTTKPVSTWTKEQILEYVNVNNVNIEGLTKGSEVAEAVKKHLEG